MTEQDLTSRDLTQASNPELDGVDERAESALTAMIATSTIPDSGTRNRIVHTHL